MKRVINIGIAELTNIKEEKGAPKAEQMIAKLVEEQETTVRTAREVFALAKRASDEAGGGC
jgi:starvation-inducible DNA-binding protein